MKSISRLVAIALACVLSLSVVTPNIAYANDTPSHESTARSSSLGEEAVGDLLLQAMSLLGVAYRFGGSSPTTGLDCSGFIQYIFKKSLRVNLPRTAAEMARVGKNVDKSELSPGDLVFFNTRGFRYSHVGIYIGNGKFIHAPRTGKNVEVTNLNLSYWQGRYNGARRVVRGESAASVSNVSEREQEKEDAIAKFADNSNAHMAGAAALVGSAAAGKAIHSRIRQKSSSHALVESNSKKKNAPTINNKRTRHQSSKSTARQKTVTQKEKRTEAKKSTKSSRNQKNERKSATSSKKKVSVHSSKTRSTKHKKS